jgi:hypothetical protein
MNRPVTRQIAALLLTGRELDTPPDVGLRLANGTVVDLNVSSIRDLMLMAETADQLHDIVGRTLRIPASAGTRRRWREAAETRLGELRAEALVSA